ncbi:EAL domain-containing protein [Bradyrhizobium sp. dw_78]|uniref:bifunctional diguanylate cyclase/phosphodiesterase n=1 Tax=Bradyrhizobium sp. dw_78 TaxID=2719793 RepID=UPI001BD5CEA9|nr:EAL domain-containing protein [Bradyrhizobium sp. dw_78]
MPDNIAENGRHDDPAALDHRNPLNLLILGGILLIAAIAIGTSLTIISFRQRALSNSARELQNTVLLLSRHFDRELDNFDAIQRDFIRRMKATGIATPAAFDRQMSGEDAHNALRTFVSNLSDMTRINIFDASGQLVNSSMASPLPSINIADRDYFQRFKNDPQSPDIVIAPLRSRFSAGWTTVIARKIVGPDGTFLGVVARGLSPANFETFFESLTLGEGSAIQMLHRDGTMLARYPHIEAMMGRDLHDAPVQKLLVNTDHATLRLLSPVDGEDRLAAAHTLSQFPLLVLATVKISTALADWRAQTRFLVGAAALATLVIGLTLFLIVRKLSQQHRNSERRLELEKERLDTAINNMSQGLLLYGRDARVVLFNQRYVDMYYGPSCDVVKPGVHFRDLIAYRKANGSFKGDIEAFCTSVLHTVAEKQTTHSIMELPDGREISIGIQPLKGGGWVATQEDITERRRAERQIAHLAHYDALTDLPNRALFREQLERELERVRRGERLAMFYIDIDEFKSINDSLGHPVGDELLKEVASRLRNCIRETDFVARLGGDEFAIVQTGAGEPDDVMELVRRIQETIRKPYECLGHHVMTDASIGIALAPHDATDLDQLLRSADLAMYGAKADGRRTYRFFEAEMDARVKARRALELDMRQAIADRAFELHYQPVVNLHNNEIVGCEALLRWRHPVRGMISPAEFIPVAEETGLICEIGDWALATACAEAMNWPPHVRLAVNVSPVQLRSDAFSLKVVNVLAATGLPANRLELEITEAVLIRDDETARSLLQHLRSLGVRIALDDFGTGYSSLSYLRRFPFDKIKIDRSFVDGITEVEGSAAIVRALVNIADAQHMTTTAEGIETEPQREMLRDLGCTEMQGFLFSRPRPAAEIRALLSSGKDRVVAA